MPIPPAKLRRVMIRDALTYWLYIPAAVIGGGKLTDLLLGFRRLPPSQWVTAGALMLGVAGIILIQKATRDLQLYGNGTPNPMAPPQRLVTAGSYAFCRHPMFLGYDLAALGAVLLCRSWGMLTSAYPLFILLQNRFLRCREESLLLKRFGTDYHVYREQVPLLVPHLFQRQKPS